VDVHGIISPLHYFCFSQGKNAWCHTKKCPEVINRLPVCPLSSDFLFFIPTCTFASALTSPLFEHYKFVQIKKSIKYKSVSSLPQAILCIVECKEMVRIYMLPLHSKNKVVKVTPGDNYGSSQTQ